MSPASKIENNVRTCRAFGDSLRSSLSSNPVLSTALRTVLTPVT
jgi:hypothetical protein